MTIKFSNSFHKTIAHINTKSLVLPYTLSEEQYQRVKHKLCGSGECACGKIDTATCRHHGVLAIEPSTDGTSITVDRAFREE